DDAPWYILGYREAANPLKRDTLMMLDVFPNPNLSERAHDALLAFWRGMERRDHQRYFKPNTVNKPSGTR
ncbi:MAG TPA: hypothetical protein VHV83_13595, partial [Armatimonadota bacterium]|nr:hypothetical protein [Armatimonadota bacterium]